MVPRLRGSLSTSVADTLDLFRAGANQGTIDLIYDGGHSTSETPWSPLLKNEEVSLLHLLSKELAKSQFQNAAQCYFPCFEANEYQNVLRSAMEISPRIAQKIWGTAGCATPGGPDIFSTLVSIGLRSFLRFHSQFKVQSLTHNLRSRRDRFSEYRPLQEALCPARIESHIGKKAATLLNGIHCGAIPNQLSVRHVDRFVAAKRETLSGRTFFVGAARAENIRALRHTQGGDPNIAEGDQGPTTLVLDRLPKGRSGRRW